MSVDSSTTPAPTEQIRAVPVRHPGRWIAAAVIAVLAAASVMIGGIRRQLPRYGLLAIGG